MSQSIYIPSALGPPSTSYAGKYRGLDTQSETGTCLARRFECDKMILNCLETLSRTTRLKQTIYDHYDVAI